MFQSGQAGHERDQQSEDQHQDRVGQLQALGQRTEDDGGREEREKQGQLGHGRHSARRLDADNGYLGWAT